PTIPASEQARIFRPHYRSPSHAEQAVEGSGLGLAIVRETAAQLGGSVRVSDWADGKGTCFTVTLPSVPDGAIEST
ncbi:MAG: ATP-binding protein, partial [Burkholderiaceae bacterium]|nr:ATP-binding protein [Burkholderiaceae bacterium]